MKKSAFSHPVVKILLGVILVVSLSMILVMRLELNNLKKQYAEKEETIAALEDRIDELRYYVSMSDDEYLKEVIMQSGEFCDPNEIIYHTDIAD